MNITAAKQTIIDYLSENPRSKVIDIVDKTLTTKQAVQRHLKELTLEGIITKEGSAPKVWYSLNSRNINMNNSQNDQLKSFYYIDSVGNEHNGSEGLEYWCKQRDLDFKKYSIKYLEVIATYSKYYKNNLIDATVKMKNTFKEDCFTNKAYYSAFASIEIFGKTPLYSKLFYAKQSGNKQIMNQIFAQIKPQILSLIEKFEIDTIGFIAPTVKRQTQLMIQLQKYLNISLPHITITKIRNKISVPQKSLSRPSERIENAQQTFMVESGYVGKRVLLIDDFVGSGSSLNYVAKQIVTNKPKTKVIAYAIAGTANGIINNSNKFEVVNEA